MFGDRPTVPPRKQRQQPVEIIPRVPTRWRRGEDGIQAEVVTGAYAASVRATIAVLRTLNEQIKVMEGEVESCFGRHPDAEVYLSRPGMGLTHAGFDPSGTSRDQVNEWGCDRLVRTIGSASREQRKPHRTRRARTVIASRSAAKRDATNLDKDYGRS